MGGRVVSRPVEGQWGSVAGIYGGVKGYEDVCPGGFFLGVVGFPGPVVLGLVRCPVLVVLVVVECPGVLVPRVAIFPGVVIRFL